MGSAGPLTHRVIAALVAGALLGAPALAYADPLTPPTQTTPGAPGDTTGITSAPAPGAKTAPAPKPQPAPIPKATTPAPGTPSGSSSKSTASPSVIQTPVDPATQAFRDQLAARQQRLAAFQAQLDALDNELSIATEQYDAATARLETTKAKLATSEGDLQKAQDAYDHQLEILKLRAQIIYRGTGLDTIGVLLDSKSLSDFLNRIQFLGIIGDKDAGMAEEIANQRDSLQSTIVDLKDAKLEAESLEFNLKARRIEIELRIQERQQMLAGAQSDLLGLLGAQASTRQADEAALLKQILSGANQAGITVTPGTPVETALAYHGIPYLWGGATPAGFDCSGLVLYVFQQHGVLLPHYSGAQFLLGTPVSPADLQPSDVVFFGSPIHHVGIYMGGDMFIEAPRTGDFVKVSRLSNRSDFAGARRYPWVLRQGPIMGVSGPATTTVVPVP